MGNHNSVLKVVSLAVILAIAAGCGAFQAAPTPTPAPTATTVAAKTIVLGDISDSPKKRIDAFQPLADYLGANLGAFGIGSGAVKIAPDFDTMTKYIKDGEVDLYFDSPYPTLVLSQRAGAQPILRRWRDGLSEYHSVFFVRKDSGITSIADLKGKMMALKEPYSSSGYVMPKAYLIQQGLNPVEKSSTDAALGKDEVGYVFSNGDDNIIQWVISGKAAVGAVDNISFDKLPDETKDAFTILAQTDPIPRQLMVARAGLDPAMIEAIKQLLMGLDKTPEGQAILKKFQTTSKFDEFPGGPDTAWTRIRELVAIIDSHDKK
jgi:phosphonate transport system substrate-binding protein